jgi:putative sigma-54 modulation protein
MTYDIQFVQMSSNEALEKLVSEKLYTLGQKFNWVINADVIIRWHKDQKGKGKICEIKLSLPGPTIFASSNEKSFEAAIAETIKDLRTLLGKRKSEFHPY